MSSSSKAQCPASCGWDGGFVSVQALAEDLHFGGRPGKAVHQQKADAPPREERAESFKALHRRENPCRRAGVSPGPAKVFFVTRRAGFHPAGAWQDRPLRARDVQRRRKGDHVLIVAAHVKDKAVPLAVDHEVALDALVHDAVHHGLVGGEAVRRADFGAQGKAEAVHVADDGVAGLQLAQALKEVGAHLAHAGFRSPLPPASAWFRGPPPCRGGCWQRSSAWSRRGTPAD